ncbi:MAG TPA: hypothetical protein VLJ20_01695 [Acetobacteraceae bacterium]|nr:hypothetical protein [Acetobacteraceae bacterium]
MNPLPALAIAVTAALTLAPAPGHAANADNPYGNVDHRNDAGNDTGDSKVDQLNAGQLNQDYRGPLTYPNGVTVVAPGQPIPTNPAPAPPPSR